MKKLLFGGLVSLLSLAAAPAQTPAIVYGKMFKLPMMSFCMDSCTHGLEASNLRMKANSSTVNMANFVGQYVRVEGTFYTGVTPNCENMKVTKVTQSADYHTMTGTPTVGGTLTFTMYGSPGSFHALLVAPGRRIYSLMGPLGIMHMTTPFLSLTSGPVGTAGSRLFKLPIPNLPVLRGARLTFQSAAVVVKPTLTPLLLNLSIATIK